MQRAMRQLFASGLVSVTVGIGFIPATAPPASAATVCGSGVPGDVNGDGYAEVAVSSRAKHARGAVNVFYGHPSGLVVDAKGTARDDQYLTQDTPGIPGKAANLDRFGSATSFGDFNGDGCADLAIGAEEDNGTGSVTVLRGSKTGLTTKLVDRITPTGLVGSAGQGATFGSTLAVGDLDGNGIDDLVVGMPYLSIGDKTAAGGVAIVYGSSLGLEVGRASVVVTKDTPGVAGTSNAQDHFGATAAIGDFDGNGRNELAVGAPRFAVGAGSVNIITFGANGELAAAQPGPITLDRAGMPGGGSYEGDDFGQTLATGDVDADGRDDLAVGAPQAYEPSQSGVVYLLRGSAAGLTTSGVQSWTQGTAGVPGAAASGGQFGVALAMGRLDTGPTDDLVIGAPYAAVGSIGLDGTAGPGTATVLFGGPSGLSTSGARLFNQAVPGIAGTAEAREGFGEAVAVAYVQGGSQASLIVGSPHDRLRQKAGAGRVNQLARETSGPTGAGSRSFDAGTAGVKGTTTTDGWFGTALNGPRKPW